MAKRIQKIYWNMDEGQLEDENGNSLRSKDQYPYVYLQENLTVEVHFITDDDDSSSASGKYQRLDDTMWFKATIDNDYISDDSSAAGPLCKVLDTEIDETSAATGILSFTLDANTVALANELGTSAQLNDTSMEILGYSDDSSASPLEFVVRFPFICKNIMNPRVI